MKIAIVGGGLSGGSTLKTIIDHPNFTKDFSISVFEPRDILGVGLPYSPDDKSVMLNVSPEFLSVNMDNRSEFIEWLESNYKNPTNFEDLVSRVRYGKYLKEKFQPYFNHKQVTVYKSKVIDLDVLNKDKSKYLYRLKTKDGYIDEIYDVVFLALGHPDYADYYDLKGKENYINNPYPMQEKISSLKNDDKVGIIGSGATGIDLMRYIITNYDLKNPLTYYVRNKAFNFADIPYEKENFKFSFSKEWIEKHKDKETGLIPFEFILKTFINDIASEGVDVKEVYNYYKEGSLSLIREAVESKDQDLALIHAYHSKLVALNPHLYNCLSGQDKDYYHSHYHDKLVFFKSRVPFKTFIWLFKLLDNNQIKVVSGLNDVIYTENNKFQIKANNSEVVDILINATGFNSNLSEVAKNLPLIKNLYNKNIILPHLNGNFVLINWPQAQIINQKYGLMDNLFFFGLLVGGTQHENNDAELTIQLASNSANYFMNSF